MHPMFRRLVAMIAATALAASLVPGVALAGQASTRHVAHSVRVAVSQPRFAGGPMRVDQSFEVTGVVTPAISKDDTSTSVVVQALEIGRRGRFNVVASAPATLTGAAGNGTGYSAKLSIRKAGQFLLMAIVMRGGHQVASSQTRPVKVLPALSVSKPTVTSGRVRAGVAFTAIGIVEPLVAAGDPSTGVIVQVTRLNRNGSYTVVASATAGFTGASGRGTGYSATLTVATPGTYLLGAVGTRNGTPVAWSDLRPLDVAETFSLSTPRVAVGTVAVGATFEATGVVLPALTPGDTSVGVSVRVIQFGRHGGISVVTSSPATFTGVSGKGTGYSAILKIANAGGYFLQAVGTRDGKQVVFSDARPIRVK